MDIQDPNGTELVRDIVVDIILRATHPRRGRCSGYAVAIIIHEGEKWLRYWDQGGHQHRRARLDDIETVVEHDNGQIFHGALEWLADLSAHPRFRPTEQAARSWYTIRAEAEILVMISRLEPDFVAAAAEIIDRTLLRRLGRTARHYSEQEKTELLDLAHNGVPVCISIADAIDQMRHYSVRRRQDLAAGLDEIATIAENHFPRAAEKAREVRADLLS